MRLTALLLALCCLQSCGFLYSAYIEDVHPAPGRFVQLGDYRIHYERAGEGPPLVFVHGNNGSSRDLSLSPLYPLLIKHFDVISIDRPGYGFSSRPFVRRMSVREHATILKDTLNILNIEEPIIMGHSVGGAVSLAYALEHQDSTKGLILLGSVAYPWPGTRVYASQGLIQVPVVGDILAQTVFVPLGLLLRDASLQETFGTNPAPDYYGEVASGLALRPRAYQHTARDQTLLWESMKRQSARYSELTLPILAIHGKDDKTVWLEYHSRPLSRSAQNIRLRVLEGVAHQPHHSSPNEVWKEIQSFMNAMLHASSE